MKQENVALNNIPVGALGLIPMPGTEDWVHSQRM